jgi:hypothetical protein
VKTLCFVLEVVLCSALLQAQGKDSSRAGDTLRVYDYSLNGPGIVPGKGGLLIPLLLQPEGVFDPSPGMCPGLPLALRGGPIPLKADLMSPYLLRLHRESQLNPLYMVLESMELGGAAYVAYRHIKKYGFLH